MADAPPVSAQVAIAWVRDFGAWARDFGVWALGQMGQPEDAYQAARAQYLQDHPKPELGSTSATAGVRPPAPAAVQRLGNAFPYSLHRAPFTLGVKPLLTAMTNIHRGLKTLPQVLETLRQIGPLNPADTQLLQLAAVGRQSAPPLSDIGIARAIADVDRGTALSTVLSQHQVKDAGDQQRLSLAAAARERHQAGDPGMDAQGKRPATPAQCDLIHWRVMQQMPAADIVRELKLEHPADVLLIAELAETRQREQPIADAAWRRTFARLQHGEMVDPHDPAYASPFNKARITLAMLTLTPR